MLGTMAGRIYCGDNLDVLAEYIPRESVDLIYLDPPFNSQRTYNLIYKDQRAQEEAFKDYWSWEGDAASKFHEIVESSEIAKAIRTLLRALHDVLIDNDSDQLAYLTMMTPRLVALHRALKPTGSLYLHCDPTASHYLKLVLDSIFGIDKFETEIIWQRSTGKALSTRRLPNNHDVILVYRKGDDATWNVDDMFMPYDEDALDEKTEDKYKHRDADGRRYTLGDLTNPNPNRPNLTYEFLGHTKVWRWRKERMMLAHREGLVVQPSPGAVPRLKRYLDEQRGKPLGDVWTDIPPLNSQAKERLPYPTQKPLALLDRIIRASSTKGDVILDPFCGCGTTVEAAERLGRRWIGIDIARKAVEVIEGRFERVELAAPEIVWHPADPKSAEALAERDKRQFEDWALRKIRATRIRKKDRGIDGEAVFKNGTVTTHVLVSVKGGKHLAPTFVRDLRGTLEREKASIGILLSMFEPSKEMKLEATRAGYLSVSDDEGPIPRIQLVTVAQLFDDPRPIRAPGENKTQMPRPSVPPPPGSGVQLALGIDTKVQDAKPQKPARKPPVKTYPKAPESQKDAKAPAKRRARG